MLLLGWLGAQNIEEPFVTICEVCTFIHFGYFLFLPFIC